MQEQPRGRKKGLVEVEICVSKVFGGIRNVRELYAQLTANYGSPGVDVLALCLPLFGRHSEAAKGGILTSQPHGDGRSRLEGIGAGHEGQQER
jgi:hypothetical protein